MRKLGFFLLAAVAACSSKELLPRSAQGTPVLEVRGALKSGPHALGQADLERLPRAKLRGVEPRSDHAAEWEGASLAALVTDRVDLRKGADTAIVRTSGPLRDPDPAHRDPAAPPRAGRQGGRRAPRHARPRLADDRSEGARHGPARVLVVGARRRRARDRRVAADVRTRARRSRRLRPTRPAAARACSRSRASRATACAEPGGSGVRISRPWPPASARPRSSSSSHATPAGRSGASATARTRARPRCGPS